MVTQSVAGPGSVQREALLLGSRRAVTGLLLGLVVWLVGAESARAELQRVEVVGTYGIREDMRTRVIPRDMAIQEALWEGVSRVARDLIAEAAPIEAAGDPDDSDGAVAPGPGLTGEGTEGGMSGTADDQLATLRQALGSEMLPYTRSFRILEDQGEGPVLFEEDPEVATEYVVIVEVIVDVSRVGSALEGAGLIAVNGGVDSAEAIAVELVGLAQYEALQAVIGLLGDSMGATRVETREFTPGRQVLSVVGPFGPRELAARLAALASGPLALEARGIDEEGRRVRILARWSPAPVEEADPS